MDTYREYLENIYNLLLQHFGPRGWWPGDSQLEIILGAVLTQAVAWKNVEKAIDNLKGADLLNLTRLDAIKEDDLADLIKPALYHRQKAKKIKILITFIYSEYEGDLNVMFKSPLEELRVKLLSVWGIGPETADSILLYAGNYKIFVIDAYTLRIFYRLGLCKEDTAYSEMQDFMHKYVIPEVRIYNEYHALLVALGANYCSKSRPRCNNCPLAKYCKYLSTLQEK
ncbi:MAG: endonuclease III domain-containing protein [Syntrophomonadaceae bacterium]|nr:endonuclease III domain-containing protein [Syntrophomonadaceae bacterium]MDD4548184.1 endonuclease III domain-containing protein [Syntrophomonadaceae bacterium]